MDLRRAFEEAQRIVDAAELSQDLRPLAFSRAIDYLISQSEDGRSSPSSTSPQSVHDRGVEPQLSRIANRLGVPTSAVQEVYYDNDGDLALSVPSSRLAKNKATGTRQIALLVAAGRQAGGFDESWTESRLIRDVCLHYGKFDPKNFGYAVSSMDDVFQIKGKGPNREIRVKQPGYERAGVLVAELTRN